MGGEKRVNHGDERTRARALGVHPARQVVLLFFSLVFPQLGTIVGSQWGV